MRNTSKALGVAALCLGGAVAMSIPAQAWDPTHPIEIIVPAGTGGGADQMARTIQGIITNHQLMKQSMVVINKSGGAGGEGFLDVKGSRGNPHKLVITLSNLFTTPLGTGIPFSWKDMTPVAMMALDEFVLWVPADAPYKTAQEYVAAALVRDEGELGAGRLLDRDRDDLVFLLGAGATHLELRRRRRLDGFDVLLRGLIRRLGVDPQDELVERHHGDRREVLPIERNAGPQRGREQVRECDYQLVGIGA